MIAILLGACAGCGPAPRAAVSLSVAYASQHAADASVSIDEQYIGPLGYVAAHGVRLPEGEHRISVTKTGYLPLGPPGHRRHAADQARGRARADSGLKSSWPCAVARRLLGRPVFLSAGFLAAGSGAVFFGSRLRRAPSWAFVAPCLPFLARSVRRRRHRASTPKTPP